MRLINSRENVNDYEVAFNKLNVLIIGVGGTGSQILESITSLPVKSITIVDADSIEENNLLRMSSVTSEDIGINKAAALAKNLSFKFKDIIYFDKSIEETMQDPNFNFDSFDIVFTSFDNYSSKIVVLSELKKHNLPYIDVGIGVNINKGNKAIFAVRSDLIRDPKNDCVMNYHDINNEDIDGYSNVPNIQFNDFNKLNAGLAMLHFRNWAGGLVDWGDDHLVLSQFRLCKAPKSKECDICHFEEK